MLWFQLNMLVKGVPYVYADVISYQSHKRIAGLVNLSEWNMSWLWNTMIAH